MTQIEVAPTVRSQRSIYLLDVDDEVDEELLRSWVRGQHRGDIELVDVVSVPHLRAPDSADRLATLARVLDVPGDVMLRPLRVAWLAVERDGDRTVRIRDVVRGDPRNPSLRRKRVIARNAPERVAVITGDAASLAEVGARPDAPSSDDATDRARHVARLAFLSLERAEYRTRGAQYKVPRLVREELMESTVFRSRADAFADSLDRDRDEVWSEIHECLDEMVTGYSRLFLDLMARLGKRVKRPGYGDEIDYDPAQLARIKEVLAKHPAVILPSHKSNLDATVIPVVLHENGLPPTHTFAGINMAFWPFGTIFRRAGRIFIRRDVKDDPVYRWVLREYLGYLVEKRFNLEWYVEGTRSRTGKLAPPKFGLLRYIADACREGRADDVAMVPVSIMYDQLDEVREFASEATGHAKKAETLGWALKFVRSQRGQYGRIYVRFAEPIWLRQALEESVGGDAVAAEMSEDDIKLQKLAFEVSTRINSVTPITGSALVCMVLLATRGRALTSSELHRAVGVLIAQSRSRGLPLAASAERLETEEGVRGIAESLAANDTVEAYDGGDESVYRVGRDHHLAAAFYRNTIVHFFVGGAIAELALIHAMETGLPAAERTAAFWDEAFRLRDLLKFDFFFEQREEFRESLKVELDSRAERWEERLVDGTDPGQLLDQLQPLQAFGILRPFVEAYLIVATALFDVPDDSVVERKPFVKRCLALGEQWLRQERVRSPEAVSKHLFEPAYKLAEHRGLIQPGPDALANRRRLVEELTDIARRIDIVEQRTYEASGRSLTRASW